MEATQETYNIASRHDAVMRAIELKSPIGDETTNTKK